MEYLDIVDENNTLIGESRLRSEVHSLGLWHRVVRVHVFKKIENTTYFLVHLRSKDKDAHPNCWDYRFGGHVKNGETINEALKNELMEEIGLEFEQNSLIEGGVHKRDLGLNKEFIYFFCYAFDGDISELKFNDGEVQEIKWMSTGDVLESMENNAKAWSGSKAGFVEMLDTFKLN